MDSTDEASAEGAEQRRKRRQNGAAQAAETVSSRDARAFGMENII